MIFPDWATVTEWEEREAVLNSYHMADFNTPLTALKYQNETKKKYLPFDFIVFALVFWSLLMVASLLQIVTQ